MNYTENIKIINEMERKISNCIKDTDILLKYKLKNNQINTLNIVFENKRNCKKLFRNIEFGLSSNVKEINFYNLTDIPNQDIEEYLNVSLEKSQEKKYKYIYDKICDELDENFRKNNYCDFKDNRCIAQRKNKTCHADMGCCYTFEYSKFDGLPRDTGVCNYFDYGRKTCSQKCIACKMFTCRYLRKNGVKFEPENYKLLDIFLNKSQKDIIKKEFFKTEEEIIEKLISNK